MHQNLHRAELIEAFPRDPAINHNIPAHDLHRLSRQPHDTFHIGLARLAREVEDRHFPAPGRTEIVEEFLDQHPVSVALDGRQAVQVVLPAVRADRPRRMPLLIDADHEDEPAVGTGQLAMMTHQRRRHRTGRHDIGFGREGAEHEHAETKHHHQVNRLAHHAHRRILLRTTFPGRRVIGHGASFESLGRDWIGTLPTNHTSSVRPVHLQKPPIQKPSHSTRRE